MVARNLCQFVNLMIFSKLVGGSAGGAAPKSRADGDGRVFFGNILMNGVVGETSEREAAAGDKDFDFVRGGELADAIEDVGRLVEVQHLAMSDEQ